MQHSPHAAPWCPDAAFWLGVMRRHGGLVRATERRLMIQALRAALSGGAAPRTAPSPARFYAGALGSYEREKSGFVEAGLPSPKYTAYCRRAARRAGV